MQKYIFQSTAVAVAVALCLAVPVSAVSGNDSSEYAVPNSSQKAEKPSKIRMSKNMLDLTVGDTWTLSVKFTPSTTTDDITWSSNSNDVVTVDDQGNLEAVKAGKATITAKSAGGLKTTCYVTVKREGAHTQPKSFDMNVSTMTVRINQTRQLWVLFNPSGVTDKTVTWSSSHPDIARVDDEGVVTGIAPGTAVITAENEYGTSSVCTVTVPGKAVPGLQEDTVNTELPGSGELLTVDAVKTVVEQTALITTKGIVGTAVFENKTAITASALAAAAYTAELNDRDVLLEFDTTDDDGKIIAKLVIDPKKAKDLKQDIRTDVYVSSKQAAAVSDIFDKYFQNKTAVIHCGHSGNFGSEVEVSARVSLAGMDKNNLHFYTYDNTANRFYPLAVGPYSTSTSLLRFRTTAGGYIVVSDGPLSSK